MKPVATGIFLLVVLAWLGVEGLSATEIDRGELTNGLGYALVEQPGRPLVGIAACKTSASRTEPPGLSGATHLLEHLVLRGGTGWQTEERFRQTRSDYALGAVTSPDSCCFRMLVPSADLEDALLRLADGLFHLEITATRLNSEREIVRQEYLRGLAFPTGPAMHQLAATAFAGHPYEVLAVGRPKHIESMKLEDVRSFYRSRFRPDHFFVSLVGDFDSSSAREHLRRIFGSERPSGQASFLLPHRTLPPQRTFRQTIRSELRSSSAIALGCRVPSAIDLPMTASLEVLARLWSDEEVPPGADAISVSLWRRFGMSLFVMSGSTDDPDELVGAMLNRLLAFAIEGPEQGQVEAARAALNLRFKARRASPRDRALFVAQAGARAELGYESAFPAMLQQVSAAAIRNVIAEVLKLERCSLSVVHPDGQGDFDYQPTVQGVREAWPRDAEARPPEQTRGKLANAWNLVGQTRPGTTTVALKLLFPTLDPQSTRRDDLELLSRLIPNLHDGSGETLATRLARLGADFSTAVSTGGAEILLVAEEDRFEAAFHLLASALQKPEIPDDEIEQTVATLEATRIRSSRRASHLAHRRLVETLTEGAGDSSADISPGAAARRDLATLLRTPGTAIVVGPAVADAVAERVGRWPTNLEIEPLDGSRGAGSTARAGLITIPRSVPQARLAAGVTTLGARDPRFSALRVLAQLLQERLFEALIWGERTALCYEARVSIEPGPGDSLLIIETASSLENLTRARERVWHEVERLVEAPLEADEVERAKRALRREDERRLETHRSEAALLAEQAWAGLDRESWSRNLEAVSSSDLSVLAHTHLRRDRWVEVVVAPE